MTSQTNSRDKGPLVAVIGTGLVGRAWAIAFAKAGHAVTLWDQNPSAPGEALAYIDSVLPDLAAHDLLDGQTVASVRGRLRPATNLAEALAGAIWVQESVPESVEIKTALYSQLDGLAPRQAILASSTSAILPSLFTAHLAGRERCLVAHPLNPPYLIPAAELVPAPWTGAEVMETARAFLIAAGMKPILMKREIDGFLMNRLQGAVLDEAFRLVADGYARVEDVDVALKDGLALRWSFIGPFEVMDLNAPGGIADYVARYRGIYERLAIGSSPRASWTGDVLATVTAERRAALSLDGLARRTRWRDKRLMALAAHKKRASDELGD